MQNFHKIEALLNHSKEADILVIWDADCVPVKRIPIFNEAMKILYMDVSREFHAPYFENIERLLGLKKNQKESFVIPSFPIRSAWITEFINFIEKKHGCSWAEAIILNTDFSLISGFSETETLGTWVAHTYPKEWVTVKGKWERLGQSRFGRVENFNKEQILKIGQKKNIDIITFERWDKPGLFSHIKRVGAILKSTIKKLIQYDKS